jgi:hypothetical protein
MRILLIGDLKSSFVRDYALHLKHSKLGGLQIDLFATMPPFDPAGTQYFNRVFSYPYLKLFEPVRQFRVIIRLLYLFFFLLFQGRKYSHIHIHYLLIDFSVLTFLFRLLRRKPIVTVFGSDLLRISGRRKRMLTGFLRNIKLITFANPELRDEICMFYGINREKSRICRFGLSPLDLIKALKLKSKKTLRSEIGLPKDKVIVCIGNNSNSNQQHLKILSSLAENQELQAIAEKLHFVFPMTYGNEIKYKELVIDNLNQFPFSQTTFSEYLDDIDNARLRLSSDIMIQLQANDQLSGAMQEHLFAGNVVITGAWLPYKLFRSKGIFFREIQEIANIGDELVYCLNNLDREKQKCIGNDEKIYSMSGWENTISDWVNVYIDEPVNNYIAQ